MPLAFAPPLEELELSVLPLPEFFFLFLPVLQNLTKLSHLREQISNVDLQNLGFR